LIERESYSQVSSECLYCSFQRVVSFGTLSASTYCCVLATENQVIILDFIILGQWYLNFYYHSVHIVACSSIIYFKSVQHSKMYDIY